MHFLSKILHLTKAEFILWLHETQGSLGNYILKILLAVLIYFIVSDSLTSIIKKVLHEDEDPRYRRVHGSNKLLAVILYVFKYSVLIIVLYDIIRQLNIVETSPSITLLVSTIVVLLLLLTGAFFKGVKKLARYLNRLAHGDEWEEPDTKKRGILKLSRYSETRKSIFRILSVLYKLIGIAVGVAIAVILSRGISYVLETKGRDITHLIDLPEYQLSKELQTDFKLDTDLKDALPINLGESVFIKSDGKINIIYYENQNVGVFTTDRDYRFYDVGINQTVRSSVSGMSYPYEDTSKMTQTTLGVYSDSYLYWNWTENTCLVLTVNSTSHRVAALTYFTDLRAVQEHLNVYED